MFIARFGKPHREGVHRDEFSQSVKKMFGQGAAISFPSDDAALAQAPYADTATVQIGNCVATGAIFEPAERRAVESLDFPSRVAAYYKDRGAEFVGESNAQLACAVFDADAGSAFIARDHLGIEPLYFAEDEDAFVFSSSAPAIAAVLRRAPSIDHTALARFLCFNYNPAYDTVWQGIHKFPPGHYARIVNGSLELTKYWHLSYANVLAESESEIAQRLRDAMQRAIETRTGGANGSGVFVSGGLDSSTVLGVLSKHAEHPVYSYSYRCRGQGFDESHYARLMAESANSTHKEIEYTAENVALMSDLVKSMSEPFCDIGINIATALLGRAAHSDVSTVLTGDGGDELFGGHPIYEADKVAAYTDRLPAALTRAIGACLVKLPDSDKKKTLAVKLKRFGESLRFPRELKTQRWRLYYLPEDLSMLLKPEVAEDVDRQRLFGDVLKWYPEADTNDALGRTLYADYFTVVDFYLRRNDLNRSVGIQTRYPFFDKELVELCARVPSSLKIKGWFDTKYIMKRAIEPWLPKEIVYRKDKLGHSIPLKNWIRDNAFVREFVGDMLSTERLQRRGIVNVGYVKQLWTDHMASRVNNSHRLWTLAVLELWLDEHFGRGNAP